MAEREVVVTYRLQQDPRNAQTMREMAGSARDVSAKKERDREFEDFQRVCVRKGAMEVREEQRAAQEGLRIRAAVARERNRMAQEEQRAQERAIALSERASRAQEVANRRVMTYSTRALGGAISMGRGFALLGILGEKDSEAMLKAFIKIEAGFSILRGGVSTVVNLSKAWEAVGMQPRAAAAAQAAGAVGGVGALGGTIGAGAAAVAGLAAATILSIVYSTYRLATAVPEGEADRSTANWKHTIERQRIAEATTDKLLAAQQLQIDARRSVRDYAVKMAVPVESLPISHTATSLMKDYRTAQQVADESRRKMGPDRESDAAEAETLRSEAMAAQEAVQKEREKQLTLARETSATAVREHEAAKEEERKHAAFPYSVAITRGYDFYRSGYRGQGAVVFPGLTEDERKWVTPEQEAYARKAGVGRLQVTMPGTSSHISTEGDRCRGRG